MGTSAFLTQCQAPRGHSSNWVKFGSFQGFVLQTLCCGVTMSQKVSERKNGDISGPPAPGSQLVSLRLGLQGGREVWPRTSPGHTSLLPHSLLRRPLDPTVLSCNDRCVFLLRAVTGWGPGEVDPRQGSETSSVFRRGSEAGMRRGQR